MGFERNLGRLRETGRKLVLPVERIKWVITEELWNQKKEIDTVIDVGAGTLYWSKWLSQYAQKTYAVDIVYEKSRLIKNGKIVLCNDIRETMESVKNANTLVWACDVLHHFDKDISEEIIRQSMENYHFIVIKDINACHKLGNFLNRLHDRILNGEKIRDIDPYELLQLLQKHGFKTRFFEMRKLWYPHFMIVAERQ